MTLTIQRAGIPVPLTIARGGTGATTAPEARDALGLGDIATLDAPGGTTTFLRADKTWAVPPGGGGGGAPTDAEYIVGSTSTALTAERVLTTTPTIAWDLATAGQAKANVPDASLSELKLVFTDITNKDATTLAHGLLRKLSGVATQYLDGTGTWSVPAGGGGGAPLDAEYITSTAHGTLTAERVLTDTASVTWDRSTAGQIKATAVGGTNYWTRTTSTVMSLATGLVAFWSLDTLNDSKGTNHLTNGGGATFVAGKIGNCVNFGGTTGHYLTCADNADLSTGDIDFTWAFWIKWTAITGAQRVFHKGYSGGGVPPAEYLLTQDGIGGLTWFVSNNSSVGSIASSVTVGNGTWYLLICAHDAVANTVSIQVNNGTVNSSAYSGGGYNGTYAFTLSGNDNRVGNFLNAQVDSLAFWKRTLTTQERTDLWNGGAGLSYETISGAPPWIAPATATDRVLAGLSTPLSSEPLESAGGLKLGNALGTTDGTLRWTGSDFEGRKGGAWVSMTAGAGGQPLDATLTALAGLATGADQLPYATGTDTFAQTPLTPLARTLLDDTTQAAMQTTLGLVPGTQVQPQDAELTALAGLASVADRLPYFTGTGTAALATFTAAGRALVDDADAAAQRTTLGLASMAQQDAGAVAITGGSATFTATVTGNAGFYVPQNAADNTYALYSDRTAGGTDRYGLRLVGTAPNYINGNVGLRALPLSTVVLFVGCGAGLYGLVTFPTAGTDAVACEFRNQALTAVGSIYTGATSTAFNTSSDVRLKHSWQPLTDSLALICRLNPISHRWNIDDSYGEGFLAHELQREMPLAVTGEPDAVNADGSIKPQGVDHSKLIPRLTAALQEVAQRLDALEAALGL